MGDGNAHRGPDHILWCDCANHLDGVAMSQTLRMKRELREVVQIGKPTTPRLVDGMTWHSAATHSDVSNFLARQIARGLKPKERK
jgi:hypothetical protein